MSSNLRAIPARDRAIWLLRALWFAIPLIAGPVFAGALEDRTDASRVALLIGLWTLWGFGLALVAVLLPATLTGIRILAPAAVGAFGWALIDDGVTPRGLGAGALLLVVVAVAYSALVGDRMVDGASYGDERRMLLRPSTRVMGTAMPLAWAIAVAGWLGGPILIATQRLPLGIAMTVIGLPLAVVASRALHQVSRRWIVFVPSGLVLHDHDVLAEPVLFRRTAIERLGPAVAGTPARDLTNRAAGLLIECELTDPAPLGVRCHDRARSDDVELIDIRRFLFAPTLPGALLEEAERRRISVEPREAAAPGDDEGGHT